MIRHCQKHNILINLETFQSAATLTWMNPTSFNIHKLNEVQKFSDFSVVQCLRETADRCVFSVVTVLYRHDVTTTGWRGGLVGSLFHRRVAT